MIIIRQRQQAAGARSRAEISKKNNQQATRCPGGLTKMPKAAVAKPTAYAFRKAISTSDSWWKSDVGAGDFQPREVVEVVFYSRLTVRCELLSPSALRGQKPA
jgi:hypothetical protein